MRGFCTIITCLFWIFVTCDSQAQNVFNSKEILEPNKLSYSSSADLLLPDAPKPKADADNKAANDDSGPTPVKAVIGLGFHTSGIHPDYTLASNTVSSTHIGNVTPQYMLGVSYELPIHYYWKNWDTKCTSDSKFRCYPLSVFVSAKFSPDANNTVNGVTFGLSHKIIPQAAILIAGSLDPYEEPSPGFIKAAVQTVNTQQALNNPYYLLFDANAMKNNSQDAFDSFSTLFITTNTDAKTGAVTFTQGNPIFQGNPLITHYHPGFILGVALTPDFKSFLGIK